MRADADGDLHVSRIVSLVTGADARLRNESGALAVVLVNGGSAKAVPGTWSATSELLADELAPRFPELAFVEVRYRIKTWNELESCMADGRAALDLAGRPSLLVGFSMGGAVSIGVAGHPAATAVLGLAPWIPERLSLEGLRHKRLDVLHGAWDRYLPGIPGVSAASSRRGYRACAGARHRRLVHPHPERLAWCGAQARLGRDRTSAAGAGVDRQGGARLERFGASGGFW